MARKRGRPERELGPLHPGAVDGRTDRSTADLVCGVDEAGRGPLAGPVYAAAVILDPLNPIAGLRDSKKLSAARREILAVEIRAKALGWAVGQASVEEIDSLNILQATMLAMRRAVEALSPAPTLARVDGNRAPPLGCAVETLVRGDALDPAISAASILAKTARDADLLELHARWPEYRFDIHKGYPTATHLALLRTHGPCPVHRRSFGPVRAVMGASHSAGWTGTGAPQDSTETVASARPMAAPPRPAPRAPAPPVAGSAQVSPAASLREAPVASGPSAAGSAQGSPEPR